MFTLRVTRRTDAHPNVEQDLHKARRELSEFVSDLRKWGVSI
mgnify:CR=1 FL=1